MIRKLKFKDVNGKNNSIIAADVEQFSHHVNPETGKECTLVQIDGDDIFADCHLLDFTRAWNAAIAT